MLATFRMSLNFPCTQRSLKCTQDVRWHLKCTQTRPLTDMATFFANAPWIAAYGCELSVFGHDFRKLRAYCTSGQKKVKSGLLVKDLSYYLVLPSSLTFVQFLSLCR
ncbi:hypothetical protein OBBRIDRAFT_256834 [Obba rivulosa]|uniref:Uncharacterized protein n=1 Tax=Obba rivulosa TaxID=1052685 RepID=A0A8E2APW3_9APHY|nr:hypothetical protein OBBRIDRAFT_256834 [Obba rivulosa]